MSTLHYPIQPEPHLIFHLSQFSFEFKDPKVGLNTIKIPPDGSGLETLSI